MPEFRLYSKNVFLTYPQVDFERDDLLQFLRTKEPTYLLVGSERHADGGRHYHCCLSFERKLNIRDPSFFDFRGFHPNIQSSRKITDVIRYCKKEGDFAEEGTSPVKRSWREVADATTKDEFFKIVKEVSPRDYVLSYDRLHQFAENFESNKENYEPEYTDFDIPLELDDWVETEMRVSNLWWHALRGRRAHSREKLRFCCHEGLQRRSDRPFYWLVVLILRLETDRRP